jgi:signal transduction histidine kinase
MMPLYYLILFGIPVGNAQITAMIPLLLYFNLGVLLIAAIGIAILRYRLFDIDLILNRTLVYGTLIGIVVSAYVLIVGLISEQFQSSQSPIIAILATGLVALLFHPLRQRLQRGVNHLLYGKRDDPYAVLSRLGQRLEAAYAPESILPTIVETVAQTLKLPHVAITLNQGGEFKIAAQFGSSKNEPITLPLIYQGEPVGELILAPRAPGEHFTAAERQLLDDLARQAGVAAHAVRLTADLQQSRERLVAAREEERRRLRRDLHDGLGPQLASLVLKLETARNRMADDPQAAALLTDLSGRTQEAVADIRRLVYALRPPALDELGLVTALREGATQYHQQGINGLNITFDAPEKLPALPAAVEVAAYRIAQEALTNVVRHAGARTCLVRLRLDESAGLLCLEIQDDGKGLPVQRRAGVGLNSMRERAEELGGTLTITSLSTAGTSVLARLPCQVNGPSPGADRDASLLSQGTEV